ncbi:30S ribosomal protein THX [Adhaeribacter radiodurans]|uniref:30S ribosomal protein THX n=1 Tax=Adhaeribacter radiodurans TaxID=2745197 RepID=A0A7L7LD83_9BACT|nr:30S ribosomal protein THX [Adhaeribacter radiodurans]QMU30802.1 30S ribosomal protein THX [Adhaeribacter radiodurans]
MGKGDIKSKKGKITKGSYGNSRPHKAKKDNASKKETGIVGKIVEKVKDIIK